jgi:uncharacterized protein YukE
MKRTVAGRDLTAMQYSHDQISALLHELDVTGAEYHNAVQDLSRTISDGNDLRASDPTFVSAYEAAHLAQQRYRRALDAYKEHVRENDKDKNDKHDGSSVGNDAAMRALTLH